MRPKATQEKYAQRRAVIEAELWRLAKRRSPHEIIAVSDDIHSHTRALTIDVEEI